MDPSLGAALPVVFVLVRVHTAVRLLNDFVQRFVLIRHRVSDGDAVACVIHGVMDFLLDFGDRRSVSGEKQNDELIAADAIGLRVAVDKAGNAFADGDERKVARVVTDGIVQRFQTVYIKRNDGGDLFGIGAAVVVKRFLSSAGPSADRVCCRWNREPRRRKHS